MTDREVMKMAFDAFEGLKKSVTQGGAVPEHWDSYYDKEYDALEALRQALAQPEREWVGLTDEEIDYIFGLAYADDMELLRTIEAKLKDKNG